MERRETTAMRRCGVFVTSRLASSGGREPQREITHIELRVGQRLRRADHGIARRLIDKARTARSRIPIVVGEMVKSALRDRRAPAGTSFKSHSDVELPSCGLAGPGGYDASALVGGRTDGALVRMGG